MSAIKASVTQNTTPVKAPESTKPLEWALWYATVKGWAVFPCHTVDENGVCSCYAREKCENPGKHPRIKGWKEQATTDPEQIREWWKLWPNANIGLATGAKSGAVALDVDPKDGGDDTLRELEEAYEQLPDTVESISGSGGRHILFEYPGWYVPPSVGKTGGIGDGLDIRGDGALIILPPSRHTSGRRYEWDLEHHPEDMNPAPMPEWLAAKIRKGTARKSQEKKAKVTGRVWRRYLQGGPIEEGTRDDTLFRIGCAMRGRGAGYEDILATLVAVNEQRCEPPLPWQQVEQKAAQAVKYNPGPSGLLNFPPTDLGNAERLADRHGVDLKYCAKLNGWHVWDGQRWRLDETGEVIRRAAETVRAYREEAERLLQEKQKALEAAKDLTGTEQEKLANEVKAAEAMVKFARQSESRARLEAMATLAQAQPGIPAVPDDFDSDPFLLTVTNGTLDLRTGKLREHKREDLITKLAPVEYDPAAKCPRWETFLHEIMDGDTEMIRYLQKAVGYSLTGDTGEQVLFFLYGTGANGKSVFLTVLQELLGDYAQQAPTSLLMAKPNDGIPNDVARLKGARFVATIETEDGKRLAENLVKQLTGGDTVSARFLRQEFFEFKPECKLWLASNHRPIIRGTDYGIWRRIHLVPFTVTIPPEKRDKRLPDKLRAELPGILRWAVDGLRMWMEEGLNPPQKVIAATEEYREDMDSLGAFLEDCCIIEPTAKVPYPVLYRAYVQWCEENGERPAGKKLFGNRLRERGFTQKQEAKARMWLGLKLAELATDGSPYTGPEPSATGHPMTNDKYDNVSGINPKEKEGAFQSKIMPKTSSHLSFVTGEEEVATTREGEARRRRGYL